ncbi:MAG TPA: winged helix-turn-helix domain-containing protein [Candidatus Saccharimonadales bacterium]|nr:winged helix-turn-helix domain-containing protein [Candidatus Saccharimonadales bacterium]
MVEYKSDLDAAFSSLSDKTRRDILQQLTKGALTISQIAQQYDMSFAAVAKHLLILEKSGLITKQRRGREQIVRLNAKNLIPVTSYLQSYSAFWESQFDSLEKFIVK